MAEFSQDHESAADHELVTDDDLLHDDLLREELSHDVDPALLEDRDPIDDRGPSRSRDPGSEGRSQTRLSVRAGDLLAGKYRVERVHARGVSGVTVDAEHVHLGQRVAIKLLLGDARAYPEHAARFLRSARLAAQLRGEHTARVIDLGTLESGVPYSVTEQLSGADLRGVLRVRESLPVVEAVDYVLQACEAIAEAHVLGLVHRNLKLSNLFLAREYDGRASIKVLDHCLAEGWLGPAAAAVSLTGVAALNSLAYLAPEQIRDPNSVDQRADVWALGAVLHELLTGVPLYTGFSALGLFAAIAADPATPASQVRPEIPVELESVILRCLEKDREHRWPEIGTFARQLRPFASARGRDSAERTILVLERRVRSMHRSAPPALPGSTRAITRVPRLEAAREPAVRRRALEFGFAALGIVGCSIGIGAFVAIHNLRAALAARPTDRTVVGNLSPALIAAEPIEPRSATSAVPLPASERAVTPPAAADQPPALALAQPRRSVTRSGFAPQQGLAHGEDAVVAAPSDAEPAPRAVAADSSSPQVPAAQGALFDSAN